MDMFIKKCIICNKFKSYNIKKEKQKVKTILSKGPKDRYVADIWHLP